ncbi:MAG TPA: glycosyltransferase [Longimicrobiales bacterium]|nr:glycosyltransferase [Longimicrobiales bacterium]
MTDRPVVSVVIDNYNYAALLPAAIESALDQTWPALEVIVVDDGSTDESRDIIAGYGGRIRPVLQENRGQAAAFNAGVAAARGDVICFLDSDDVWYPGKVERVMAAFAAYPEIGWLRHRLLVVGPDDRPRGMSLPSFRGHRVRVPDPHYFIEGCFPVLTSAVAMRRSLAERVFPLPEVTAANGPYPGVDLMRDADAYLAFRAAAMGDPFLSLDEDLGHYRRHAHQRYVSADDIEPIVRRYMAVAAGVATAFDDRLGYSVLPSTVFKHAAILAGLEGRSLLHRTRLAPAVAGMRRILPLALTRPRLFARQTGALALGTLAPRVWARKLMRQQGFLHGGNGA